MTYIVARGETVLIENIPGDGLRLDLEAGEDERAAIAKRLGVPAVKRLGGALEARCGLGRIDVGGVIGATIERECVASLELFDEEIAEKFEIAFALGAAGADGEIEIDEATPEPHEGDDINLGEILVQQLALAMDPYPRKPGARSLVEAYAPETKISPFAGLKAEFDKSRNRE